MRRYGTILLGASLLAAAGFTPAAAKEGLTSCELSFTLKGWSAFYKTAKGEGTITCDNGQAAKVAIRATGGGLTFGKTEIREGKGKFSAVEDIGKLFGAYAVAEAHGGAVKSGTVSLALSGTGAGFDVGIAFGKFKITRAR
jgi:hypothetical protein